MNKKMTNARKVLMLVILLIAFPASACKSDGDKSSEQIRVLEKACETLTNETGMAYEVISGRPLISEHDVVDIGGHLSVAFRVPLTTEAGHRAVGVFPAPKEEWRNLYRELYRIFGKENIDQKLDVDGHYAFCGTRSPHLPNEYSYDGKMSTLIKLVK